MSELKEHIFCDIDEVFPRGYCGPLPSHEARPYYLKSEVDKVIAEQKKACNDKDDWCLHTLKENCHHKCKRCLGKAEMCESKVYHIRRTPLCDMSEHEYWRYENDFWQRWQLRWTELADKFKEAK